MSTPSHGVVVVTVTRAEARVWLTGTEKGATPERITPPSEMARHHHVREAQHHHGHDTDHESAVFYASIADAVTDASEIVLVGHGKGKADAMWSLTRYLERKRPDVARKVVGAIDADLESLSENQILALVRQWWREHREFV